MHVIYKMSRYQNIKVNISEGQKDKIERALKAESDVSIKLSHDDLNHGDYILALTQAQINKGIREWKGCDDENEQDADRV